MKLCEHTSRHAKGLTFDEISQPDFVTPKVLTNLVRVFGTMIEIRQNFVQDFGCRPELSLLNRDLWYSSI